MKIATTSEPVTDSTIEAAYKIVAPDRRSPGSDVDRYIGKQVQNIRRSKGIPLKNLASVLQLSLQDCQLAEAGKLRFCASDIFVLGRQFDVPLSYFFSYGGEYFSDVILDESEMADVFHYFSQIECAQTRRHLLGQIKLASSVF